MNKRTTILLILAGLMLSQYASATDYSNLPIPVYIYVWLDTWVRSPVFWVIFVVLVITWRHLRKRRKKDLDERLEDVEPPSRDWICPICGKQNRANNALCKRCQNVVDESRIEGT